MTTGEIMTYISYLVDDPEFGYFTKPKLYVYINQSLKEAQKLLCAAGNNWYVKLSSRATVANQRDYLLPCNTLFIHRLELRQGNPLNPDRQVINHITLNQQDNYSTYAQPVNFYLEKQYLILVPAPQNNVQTMYLWHTPLVADVTQESDVPDLPLEFHEYLAQKAAALCFVQDDRPMENILTVYTETENRLKQAAIQRAQDFAQMVVSTRNDGGTISY